MRLHADGVLAIGIEDHEIRIAADCDRALARIQAKQFCGRRRNQFHEAVDAESSPGNTAGVDQAQAVLDPGTAVGNLGEIVASQFFLFLETKRAMIGGNHLKMIRFNPFHNFS
jgi:hypothetical protein